MFLKYFQYSCFFFSFITLYLLWWAVRDHQNTLEAHVQLWCPVMQLRVVQMKIMYYSCWALSGIRAVSFSELYVIFQFRSNEKLTIVSWRQRSASLSDNFRPRFSKCLFLYLIQIVLKKNVSSWQVGKTK